MVISMILLSGSAGFAETLKSHCTASLKREQINKVYSLLSIFEIVAEVVGGLFWTWVYEWTYGGGGSTVGMRLGLPMWVDASICLGIMVGSVMFFRMRTGGEKG